MSITVEQLDSLVSRIMEVKAEKEELETRAKKVQEALNELEHMAMSYLKQLGKDSYKCQYGNIYKIERVNYAVPKDEESRTKFFDYLKEQGVYDSMISVHSQTLNSFAKQFYEAAKERGDIFAAIPGLAQPNVVETLGKRKV